MTGQAAYQPQLFSGSDVEVLDSDSWCTPEGGPGMFGLAPVREFFGGGVDLDPCSNKLSTVGARLAYTIADDGLSQPWAGRVWVNHPYSSGQPAKWLRRCSEVGDAGEVLALPKGDWSTSWWNTYVRTAPARCLIARRVAFVSRGKRTVANFPSALVYWGPRVARFREVFGQFGEIIAAPGWTS